MADLKTKLGTPCLMQRYSLVKLPVELLLLIGRQVRYTDSLQKLRLVCKVFDEIFAPIVLSRLRLGSRYAHLSGGVSFHDLTKQHESLAFVKSLTVYSLERFVFRPRGSREHCWAALHYFLLSSTRLFRYLRSAKDTPSLSKELASVQEKYYHKKLQECLPNLKSVKWHIQINGLTTSRTSFLKVLVLLPSLKELDLSLTVGNSNIKDLGGFIYPLAQVSGLQKLTLRLHHDCPNTSDLQPFGRLIANNPNLAYFRLKWHEHEYGPLGALRDLVPVDRLAQLKHLLFDTFFPINELNVIPPLHSLQCLDICWRPLPHFWETLALNGIFIPFLTVVCVDEALCKYLLFNASLVSFTIFNSPGFYSRDPSYCPFISHLFRALETTNVAHITISPPYWAMWFHNAEIEGCLRRCVTLRKITLIFLKASSPLLDVAIRVATKTVSRLGDKISLEIIGRYGFFRQASEICGRSEDPSMQSLQQRLVFHEELQDLNIKSYFHDHIHSFEVLLHKG